MLYISFPEKKYLTISASPNKIYSTEFKLWHFQRYIIISYTETFAFHIHILGMHLNNDFGQIPNIWLTGELSIKYSSSPSKQNTL